MRCRGSKAAQPKCEIGLTLFTDQGIRIQIRSNLAIYQVKRDFFDALVSGGGTTRIPLLGNNLIVMMKAHIVVMIWRNLYETRRTSC
jgi:hypothetical protein